MHFKSTFLDGSCCWGFLATCLAGSNIIDQYTCKLTNNALELTTLQIWSIMGHKQNKKYFLSVPRFGPGYLGYTMDTLANSLKLSILHDSLLQDMQARKSLYRGRGSTACAVVNPLKKWLFVQRNFFLRQPSPQLVDDCTCGTILFLLYREFLHASVRIDVNKLIKGNQLYDLFLHLNCLLKKLLW
jgi:hypothetical protein